MKAVICTKYGGPEVLQVQEVEKPRAKECEIIVKVKASSVTTAESMMRQGTPRFARLFLGFSKPKAAITGTGYAGIVESVGNQVTQFKVGDQVFGETGLGFGTNADYICTNETHLILPKPESISYEQAACMCDGALTAQNFLTKVGKLKAGQSILINGAAGSIGSSAVQIARQMGAHITGVCSTGKIDFVKSLGAHHIIDYTAHDFTSDKNKYDVVFDTIGSSSYCDCRKTLKKSGLYISPVLSLGLLFQMMISKLFLSKKADFCATGLRPVKELKPMLQELVQWTEQGIVNQVIDKSYPMNQIAEAHRYIDTGHKKANVVLVHK
ncbi:NAD(P)-dependent alcohol dehydrogenase [Labilibacter marinus]|uniref:NAD(P)-dependent alcohol dehydrogenase n=1 Tax=Labilibacter marinus TaxID=1477105 RepID=UPI000837353B|nr:NAD(P)-dependent alcohol dehydrogenase [Labilibacter marinus]